MNIAYFLDISRGLGGAGNLLINQAFLMSKLHNVIVVSPVDGNGLLNYEHELRCEKYGLTIKGLYYSTSYNLQNINIIKAVQDSEEIYLFLKEYKIDFVHSVQLNVALELAARQYGIPNLMNIYQIEEDELRLPYDHFMPLYQSSDSELYCRVWSRRFNMTSRCIRPVSPIDNFRKRKNNSKSLNFVVIGDFYPHKRQLEGIKAFESVLFDDTDSKLYFLGNDSGDYGQLCHKYVQENGMSDKVFFHGFVSDVFRFLDDMDAYLCVSESESFPSSMVEAISYGLTVISTPVAGVPELMKDGVNSFISEDFTVESVAMALRRYINAVKTGKIEIVEKNAEKTWRDNFSRDTMRNNLDKYYSEILSDHIMRLHYQKREEDRLWQVLYDNAVAVCRDMRKNGIEDPNRVSRAGYYACIKESVREDKRVYIWGCGKYGSITLSIMKSLLMENFIVGFVDSFKTGDYLGKPIISLEELEADGRNVLLISVARGRDELIAKAKEKGFVMNETVWIVP